MSRFFKRAMAVVLSGTLIMSSAVWSNVTALATETDLQMEETKEYLEKQGPETFVEEVLTEESTEGTFAVQEVETIEEDSKMMHKTGGGYPLG